MLLVEFVKHRIDQRGVPLNWQIRRLSRIKSTRALRENKGDAIELVNVLLRILIGIN